MYRGFLATLARLPFIGNQLLGREIPAAWMGSTSNGKAVVGSSLANFWLFDERTGFDITHPSHPDDPLVYPRLTLQTSKTPVTLTPHKTAVVVVDMQNIFLSSAIGRKRGPGHDAYEAFAKKCIPAARNANIRILWLTWGITDEGLQTVPPMFFRNFGFTFESPAGSSLIESEKKQLWRPTEGGIGKSLGKVTLDNGTSLEAGRLLMRDQWNTELYADLEEAYQQGLERQPADARFHKESHSGFWGGNTEFASYLEAEGIRTLLFAGVNTDQCVLATLQDAAQQGYDTIMLKDACGTVSPHFAQDMVEFNAHKAFGFQSTCDDLLSAADHVQLSDRDSIEIKTEL